MDNGIEISLKDLNRVFHLGYSTKQLHAGIGLYVSRRLMRLQKGDLFFARNLSENTKFFGILFPQVNQTERFLPSRIEELEKICKDFENKLTRFRKIILTEEEEKQKARLFRRITTALSSNLSRELSNIENTVLEVKQSLRLSQDLTERFDDIMSFCEYCRLLADNILEIGEGAESNMQALSLLEIVDDAISASLKGLESKYPVKWFEDPLIPDIEGDKLQLKRVFMNLIKNAMDAMPSGGTISFNLVREGELVLVEVGDTGMGIKPENISKLFQKGFTTKSKGYGTGLYSIKNIIDRHHGTIEVFSKPEKGTTFRIRLPHKQPEQEAIDG
jgi:signal transduction histidine kinase